MLHPRFYPDRLSDPIKRYGSSRAYLTLLALSLLPFLIFFLTSLAALAQLLRHRAWCASAAPPAALLVALGCLYGQGIQPHLRPLVRGRDDFAFVSVVDVGAAMLAQAAFAALFRVAWWRHRLALPPPGSELGAGSFSSSSSSSCSSRRAKLLYDWEIGYALLGVHGVVAVAAVVGGRVVSAAVPFVQLPFCAFFAVVAGEYRRRAGEEAKEGEEEEEKRPLFDALVVIARVMAVRSVLGILAVVTGLYYSSLVYAVVADDVALLVCFISFWRAHPGLYLPRELLTIRFNRRTTESYRSIAL